MPIRMEAWWLPHRFGRRGQNVAVIQAAPGFPARKSKAASGPGNGLGRADDGNAGMVTSTSSIDIGQRRRTATLSAIIRRELAACRRVVVWVSSWSHVLRVASLHVWLKMDDRTVRSS
jgi:hypothetical protein